MSTTVLAPSGFEISSNHEDADSMLGSLATDKAEAKTPRVLVKDGQPVKDDGEKDETSQAASVLGKKGGDAAAAKRKLEAKGKDAPKEAKPAEAKDGIQKGKAEGADDKDDAGTTEAAGEAAGKAQKADPRLDAQARIAELAREKREAREEANRLRQELDQERRTRAAQPAVEQRKPAQAAAAPADDPEPDLSTYDGPDAYERFVKDSGRHAARQEYRAMEQQTQERQREEARGTHILKSVGSFTDRVAKAAEADESFLERTADLASRLQPSFTRAEGQPLSQVHVISDEIIKSENATGLMLHFSDNPDEFQRIAALRTPAEIQRAVAKVEGYLDRDRSDAVIADTSAGREVSRAGSPVRSVTGSPHAAEPDLSAPQSFDSFMAKKSRASK